MAKRLSANAPKPRFALPIPRLPDRGGRRTVFVSFPRLHTQVGSHGSRIHDGDGNHDRRPNHWSRAEPVPT